MQTAKEAREARRKRILERGSDRLAFITGDSSKQLSSRTSPPASSSPQAEASPADSPHPDRSTSRLESQGAKTEGLEFSDHVTAISGDSQESENLSVLMTTNFVSTSNEARHVGVTVGKKQNHAKNLIQSIELSEGIRALMACIIAIVIVSLTMLSCCGHPFGSSVFALLPAWPISLVFISDLTIIIGAFIMCSHHKSPKKILDSNEFQGIDGSFGKFSKALEVVGRFEDLFNVGLLCKKFAGTISLDCSIYIVIVVCGFSLGKYAFYCGGGGGSNL